MENAVARVGRLGLGTMAGAERIRCAFDLSAFERLRAEESGFGLSVTLQLETANGPSQPVAQQRKAGDQQGSAACLHDLLVARMPAGNPGESRASRYDNDAQYRDHGFRSNKATGFQPICGASISRKVDTRNAQWVTTTIKTPVRSGSIANPELYFARDDKRYLGAGEVMGIPLI